MRRRSLLLILALIVLAVAVVCFSACADDSTIVSGENVISDDKQGDDNDLLSSDSNVSDVQGDDKGASDIDETAPSETPNEANDKDEDESSNEPQGSGPQAQNTDIDDTSITGIPKVIETLDSDNGDLFILVNKQYTVSKSFKPSGMVAVKGDYTTNQGLEMKKEAYDAFLKMRKAAREEKIYFKICSAYRTYSTQEYLFNNSLKNRGKETTYVRSAYPGRSEHHTGYAIDITSASMGWGLSQDFINLPEGAWINEHCAEYGYIVRYPDGKTDITGYAYEPWHLRYVGIEAATEIMSQGLTLEEYLGKMPEV